MKNINQFFLTTGRRTLVGIVLCASSWQFAQAIPQKNTANTPYRATSIHDAKWNKAHPHYKPSLKRGWIKNLPHRYRIVKVHNQTYYYSHNQYYQRSGNGYLPVKIRFAPR